jgi:uncharacterized protein YkwD
MLRSLLLASVATLSLLAALLLLTGSSRAEDKTRKMLGGGPEVVTLTAEEKHFLDLTNTERRNAHLPELIPVPLLVKAAREKSQEMHDLNYWGHESPVKEKRTAMRRVLYYLPKPPKTMLVGENLCLSTHVAVEEGHAALMNSPTHRANILCPEYQYVGIGSYTGDDGRFWTTELFLQISY